MCWRRRLKSSRTGQQLRSWSITLSHRMAYEARWERTDSDTWKAVTRGRILLKPLPTSSRRARRRISCDMQERGELKYMQN